MRRRKYLVGLGAAFGLTGCSRHDEPVETLHPQIDSWNDNTFVNVEEARLIQGGSLIGMIPWAHVIISNPTDRDHGKLEINIDVFDESGSLLGQRSHSTAALPGQNSWHIFQPLTTQSRTAAEDVSATIEAVTTSVDLGPLENLVVRSSEISASSGTGVQVTGTILSEGVRGDVQLIGLLYDSDDRFRGTVQTTETAIEPNEQRDFTAQTASIQTPNEEPPVFNCIFRIKDPNE